MGSGRGQDAGGEALERGGARVRGLRGKPPPAYFLAEGVEWRRGRLGVRSVLPQICSESE